MSDAPKEEPVSAAPRGGLLRRWWRALRSPTARYSVLTLIGGGFIAGILFWTGFNTAMEATNTLEFCTSCHEMRDTVYKDYQPTIHFANRTGVRATCSDCHVPKDWGHKVVRKVEATGELYGKVMGLIDTPEKFEAKRLELAQRVWAGMQANNSRECRNCHNFDGMKPEKQKEVAAQMHQYAKTEGKTCIECHKGIAHKMPEGG